MKSLVTSFPLLIAVISYGVDEPLDLARTYFGSEEKLNSVQSIYYEGNIINPGEKGNGSFRLFLKKPHFQRMEIRVGDVQTITAVNGSEGYRQQTVISTGKGRLGILNSSQVEKIIINTVENLFFLKGTEFRSGKINYLGKTELQGRNCYKLKFSYRDNKLFYERYVDLETGKILATQDERGVIVYQRGEILSGGIRFSKSVESYKERMHLNTINFERIMVNAAMKEEIFDFPN